MTDDVSKLPDFPLHASDEFRDIEFKAHALMLERDAYRARMEALVEVVERWRKRMRHSMDEDDLAAVDALLAACERRTS